MAIQLFDYTIPRAYKEFPLRKENGKVFLTDMDGVLLDWLSEFEAFVWDHHPNPPETAPEYNYNLGHWLEPDDPDKGHEFIKRFQNSGAAHNIPAFGDALEFLPKIAELGFDFVAISSSGFIEGIPHARKTCLENNFSGLFSRMILLEPGSSKREVLGLFSPTYFCDDHPWHVELARACGHTGFCIEETDWENIYLRVKGDQSQKFNEYGECPLEQT